MPYNGSYSKRRTTYRPRRNYRKKTNLNKRIATIAKRVVRKEKVTKELRIHNYAGFKTDVLANSFNVTDLSNISPGDQADQRNGSDIVITGVRYKLAFDNARTEERYLRIIMCQPKNANDPPDITGWTDLYQDNNYANRTADMLVGDITHPLNTDVYHIFMDKLVKVTCLQTTGAARIVSGYLRLNKRLQYDNNGAGSNVPTTGNLYCIVHACENYSTTGATTTVTNFDGFFRVFFKE